MIRLYVLKILMLIRWTYFHVNPNYIKFYMGIDGTEAHFQRKKLGTIHSNYEINFKKCDGVK